MSQVTIQGNANGNGTLTIAAPNTSTDYTLTLPTESGTVLTSGGAIDVNASAPADSLAIDASGNVVIGSSTTSGKFRTVQGGSADCTVNFEAGIAGYATNLNLWGTNSSGAAYNNITSKYSSTENWYIGGGGVDKTLVFKTDATERMRIDSSGRVTMPYQPAFAAYNSSSQTISSVPYQINFNTTKFNVGSNYNTGTARFTAPVAGRYLVTASIRVDNSTDGGYGRVELRKNGSAANRTYGQQIYTSGTSSSYVSYNMAMVMDLAVNDYVEVYWDGTDSSASVSDETAFSGILIG